MNKARWLSALAPLTLLVGGVSCSSTTVGEVVLAIRTDVSMPKDIDRIRIEIAYQKTGEVKFSRDFDKLGSDESIKLPATLGFTSPEDASLAIRIRVVATRGQGAQQSARMMREIVTTVPADRTVTLPIPIEFLCDGMAEPELDMGGNLVRDDLGNLVVKSTCDDGKTCIAGKCQPSDVPSVKLEDYEAGKVFGGGTGNGDGACFDAAACFDGAAIVPVDLTTCLATAGGDVNVALLTQGAGMCGRSGCFVALDAESDAGWKAAGDKIQLPAAVCEKITAGEIVGVVAAPVGKSPCQQKRSSLPTCGPWSSSGTFAGPDPKAPSIVASGQLNPASLAIGGADAYWTNRGTFDQMGNPKADGTVKTAPLVGGQATAIAEGQASPHDIATDTAKGFVFWTNAGSGEIMWGAFGVKGATQLLGGLAQPEGIAIEDPAIAWTELASNHVSSATLKVVKSAPSASGAAAFADPSPAGVAPRRVAVTAGLTCWTYEDKLTSMSGVVACNDGAASTAIATGLKTPRSIAVVLDGSKNGAVYFATFGKRAEGGGVFQVPVTGGAFGAMTELTKGHAGFEDGEDFPNGLAIDGKAVYWTSLTRGAVMSLSGGALVEVAHDQNNPGAIAVGKDAIYWVSQGTPDKPDGAIMRLAQ